MPTCGSGFFLHLDENHSFHAKMEFGRGSNNWAEVNVCHALITFVSEKGVSQLQCFGDSLLVFSWVNMTQCCMNIFLVDIVVDIHRIK